MSRDSEKRNPSCDPRREGKQISKFLERVNGVPILKEGKPSRRRSPDSPINEVTAYELDIHG
jgi:hypothetical protein